MSDANYSERKGTCLTICRCSALLIVKTANILLLFCCYSTDSKKKFCWCFHHKTEMLKCTTCKFIALRLTCMFEDVRTAIYSWKVCVVKIFNVSHMTFFRYCAGVQETAAARSVWPWQSSNEGRAGETAAARRGGSFKTFVSWQQMWSQCSWANRTQGNSEVHRYVN